MLLKKYLSRPTVIALIVLIGAWLFCEVMSAQAESAGLKAREELWACWMEQSRLIPQCKENRSEDVCAQAVVACKAASEAADQILERDWQWDRSRRLLRFALIVTAVGALAWVGFVRPIRRRWRAARA